MLLPKEVPSTSARQPVPGDRVLLDLRDVRIDTPSGGMPFPVEGGERALVQITSVHEDLVYGKLVGQRGLDVLDYEPQDQLKVFFHRERIRSWS